MELNHLGNAPVATEGALDGADGAAAREAATALLSYARTGAGPSRSTAIEAAGKIGAAGLREYLTDGVLFADAAWTAFREDGEDLDAVAGAKRNQDAAEERALKVLDARLLPTDVQEAPDEASRTVRFNPDAKDKTLFEKFSQSWAGEAIQDAGGFVAGATGFNKDAIEKSVERTNDADRVNATIAAGAEVKKGVGEAAKAVIALVPTAVWIGAGVLVVAVGGFFVWRATR